MSILYRPVGLNELGLVQASEWKRFPPRLPEQPIFYPVTTFDYALQIARWNLAASGAGYVLRFEIDSTYLSQFSTHVVGSKEHQEYWIPAENLEEFNNNIIGVIEIIASVIH